jgi:hypothetical protein
LGPADFRCGTRPWPCLECGAGRHLNHLLSYLVKRVWWMAMGVCKATQGRCRSL